MSGKFNKTIMSAWKKINCKNKKCLAFVGWSDSHAFIRGGLFSVRPSMKILCNECGMINSITLNTTKDYLKFLTEPEVLALISPNLIEKN